MLIRDSFTCTYWSILVMIIKEALSPSVHVQPISTTCKSLGLSDQFVVAVNRDCLSIAMVMAAIATVLSVVCYCGCALK